MVILELSFGMGASLNGTTLQATLGCAGTPQARHPWPPSEYSPVVRHPSGHWIKSKSDDGAIITLEDGSVWQVDPLDRIDASLWLPITDITVVESDDGYLLVNTDDGEKARAELLHP